VPGEPPLPLLRAPGRHRGLPGRRRAVPGHRRGGDGPRARPPRLPEAGGRPRDRQADRLDRQEPGRGRDGGDPRVPRDVPGDGQDGAGRGFRRLGRVVRDARPGREVARRSFPEGPRRSREALKVQAPELPSSEWGYDDPDYLDAAKLERELRRVGEVCHQCRRCLPLCPSFPKLFELVDATPREVAGVSAAGFDAVNELCYHCKLCYNNCPYTPPHAGDAAFPALVRRHQRFRAVRDGVPLARRLTTRTDLIGTLASLAPPLMNFANRNRASRVLMEKTIGIHRDWVQPSYCFETAERWWRKRGPRGDGSGGEAVLFTTCSVEYSDPLVARSAVAVLERSGVRVELAYERCCGMPFTDVGDLRSARANAERNVALLLPHVERGAKVVVPGPSCSLMLKEEYPRLLQSEAARRVAAATRDLMEHLYELARAKQLERSFAHRREDRLPRALPPARPERRLPLARR